MPSTEFANTLRNDDIRRELAYFERLFTVDWLLAGCSETGVVQGVRGCDDGYPWMLLGL